MNNTTLRASLTGLALLAAAPALAAPATTTLNTQTDAAQQYWTPERFRAAVPLMPSYTGPRLHPGAASPGHAPKPVVVPGHAPTVIADDSVAQMLFQPAPRQQNAAPRLSGTSGLPYTTNRLFAVGTNEFKAYPYAVSGQLFFSINGSPFLCSGSVVRERIVATAGHCVSDGNGNFYSNWVFVPAEKSGAAPYHAWTANSATVTNNWHFGGGGVPNIQDDAVLVMGDQQLMGGVHRIGEIVGTLGYEYNAPLPSAITQVGYPCNLDSCSWPEATASSLYGGPSNNFVWGSAQLGGSSGGPEIQDFGQSPSGIPGEAFGGNVLVSVTSFGYTDASVQEQGGSVLGAPGQFGGGTFGDLLNVVCAGSGNC